jgi:hypothetical protein
MIKIMVISNIGDRQMEFIIIALVYFQRYVVVCSSSLKYYSYV